MSMRMLISGFTLVTAVVCRGFGQGASDLKMLYDAHRWGALYSLVQNTSNAPAPYRGAASVAFNQHPEESERLLLSVMNGNPHSPEAYEASEWLSHLYLYRGQYRSLVEVMERRWAYFPDKQVRSHEQAEIAGLRGLPNQITESSRPSSLEHEPGSIYIPFSINGAPAKYFFDTGAWISCMSESEAKRLHLVAGSTSGTMGQVAGAQVGFRTAVATDVIIGETHFRDVSFAVFPDDQEPWVDLPVGRKGIIGIQMLVGLRTVRWQKAGKVELAHQSKSFNIRDANLVFSNDHLLVSAIIRGAKIYGTVDTGAVVDTDLYKRFADKFQDFVRKNGKAGTTEMRGVGHAERFDSITLPKLSIRLGGTDTALSPAHVLLKSIGEECCIGNFGMDLFQQRPVLDIDLGAMKLRLISTD